jgi:hypothetical protein
MNEIPPVREDGTIPAGATCQAVSPVARRSTRFRIECGEPAIAIVFEEQDHRTYYMCQACALARISK